MPSKAHASTWGREATLFATTPMCCNVVALRSPSPHSSIGDRLSGSPSRGPAGTVPLAEDAFACFSPPRSHQDLERRWRLPPFQRPKRCWLLMKGPLHSIASSRVRKKQAPATTQTSTHSFAFSIRAMSHICGFTSNSHRGFFSRAIGGNDGVRSRMREEAIQIQTRSEPPMTQSSLSVAGPAANCRTCRTCLGRCLATFLHERRCLVDRHVCIVADLVGIFQCTHLGTNMGDRALVDAAVPEL